MTPWRTLPLCCYTGQPYRLSHVQFRRPISDGKMSFNAFWGTNGWPSPRGFSFSKVMAAPNDKVSWWRGSHGVHAPPGSTSKLLAVCRHSAPWVTSSVSTLVAGHPPETLSHAASALFVCFFPQQVMRKSKLKANILHCTKTHARKYSPIMSVLRL